MHLHRWMAAAAGWRAAQAVDGFPSTSLLHRYEARLETGFSNGDDVATVADQAGTDDLAGSGSGVDWVTSSFGGEPAFQGDGTEQNLGSRSAALTAPLTIAALARQTSADSTREWVFGLTSTGTDNIFAFTAADDSVSSRWGLFCRNDAATTVRAWVVATATYPSTADSVLVATWDGADVSVYVNGDHISTNTFGGTTNGLDQIGLHDFAGSVNQPFRGDVAFAAVWGAAWGQTEVDALQTYAADVYGV